MFSEKLKKARKDKGFTQKEISKLAGITQSSYSYLESGKSEPMKKTKVALAKVLGTNFGEEWIDEHLSNHSVPSRKELLTETTVEEIVSLKFNETGSRRSKTEILALAKLLDEEIERSRR